MRTGPAIAPGRAVLTVVAALALALAACGAETTPAADGGDEPTDAAPTAPDSPTPTTADPGSGTEAPTTAPTAGDDYQASAVTNAVAVAPDGSTFTPEDFAGNVVFVETFATWCHNCAQQLPRTNEAAAQAGDDAVFLILSVETNLDPAQLDTYRERGGLDNLTHFGVLTDESLAAFVDQFGRTVANAPSVPTFTIAPDGALGELHTGFESVEEILARLGA